VKKVKDFMNKKVVSFKPQDSVFDVAETFSKMGISGAPVVNKGRVVGVISETDLVKFMSMKLSAIMSSYEMPLQSLSTLCLNLIKAGKDHLDVKRDIDRLLKIKVKDVMSREVISVKPDMNIFDVASVMKKHDINRLPVVSKGRLVGIIARADLIRALVD